MNLAIRARLTLWYTAVLSLVLAASAWASYLVYQRSRLAQLDEELARSDTLVARIMDTELGQGLALADAVNDTREDLELLERALGVFAPDGALLGGRWQGLPGPTRASAGEAEPAVESIETEAGRFRLRWARHAHGQVFYLVGVAENLSPLEQELARLRRALAGGVLSTLLLAAGGGFWIARYALRPVGRMAEQARRITDRTPGSRLTASPARDELAVLAEAFNGLLGRLEQAIAQQRQFMADASHELRTPVSVARTAIEVSLARSGRAEEEYRDGLGVVGDQMRRLSGLVEDMFTLARADVAPLPLELGRLYLDELVEGCVRESRLLGERKGVALAWRGPQDVEANGDERRLRQMLMNLLDNAVRHTPAGGSVSVELQPQPGMLEIAVSDSGCGIPEAERERVFERFVRLDASRRSSDGAGLGLPIARMIAEAHGGSLVLSRSDSSGSRFVVSLPAPDQV